MTEASDGGVTQPSADIARKVLYGGDPVVALVIGAFLERGWYSDRLLKNVAVMPYGLGQASFHVSWDRQYPRYWVRGTFVSAGEDVLANKILCVPANSSAEQVSSLCHPFLDEVALALAKSFAGRFIVHDALAVTHANKE